MKKIQTWIDTCAVKPPASMQRASLRWPQFLSSPSVAVRLSEACFQLNDAKKKTRLDFEIKILGQYGTLDQYRLWWRLTHVLKSIYPFSNI